MWGNVARKTAARNRTMKSMKVGGGGRFEKMVKALKGKTRNPKAVAASIGRKKYGAKKMTKMATAGRKKAAAARMMY